ncbi:uncharacterized protein LOC128259960 [Drosophila gunungcola]|uniref:uncharacterized protein LOC128259960 n=1 Tax=Drosophila gunungcola TaxID=103775 RepID=UPI0022E92623|nr:uncharacterized protein LOC128259960 [Drosophila gunungcola]
MLLIFSVLICSEAYYFGNLLKCNDILIKCKETEVEIGNNNKIVNGLNQICSQYIGSKWTNITHCELEAVKCLLTQMNGLEVNCENISDVMHL